MKSLNNKNCFSGILLSFYIIIPGKCVKKIVKKMKHKNIKKIQEKKREWKREREEWNHFSLVRTLQWVFSAFGSRFSKLLFINFRFFCHLFLLIRFCVVSLEVKFICEISFFKKSQNCWNQLIWLFLLLLFNNSCYNFTNRFIFSSCFHLCAKFHLE